MRELHLKVETPEVVTHVQKSVVSCGNTLLIVERVSEKYWQVEPCGNGHQLYDNHLEAIQAARDLVFRLESARLMRDQLEAKLLGEEAR